MLDTRIAEMTNEVRLRAAELENALSEVATEVPMSWRQERSVEVARRRMGLLYRVMASIERDLFTEQGL